MTKRRWSYDRAHAARRCGHTYCTDCQTRRGSNRGNRNVRHAARVALHLTQRNQMKERS